MNVVKKKFVQCGDDQQADPDSPQYLEMEALDSGAGTFVMFSTDRWSIDKEEDIESLANELRVMLKTDVMPLP